jgi:hypothetical protein
MLFFVYRKGFIWVFNDYVCLFFLPSLHSPDLEHHSLLHQWDHRNALFQLIKDYLMLSVYNFSA